jgi:transketolase
MSSKPLKAVRVAFGETLLLLAEEFPQLVVLDADISKSLRTDAFASLYPERHINFGVAEQEMLAASAGLATVGKLPLACTYAAFATLRACEQVRTLLCYPNLNVKIICSHGGIEVGWDGPTHQAIEDIAVMRVLPNMTVIVPADANSVPTLLRQAILHQGPVYFRMGRNPVPLIYGPSPQLTVGKAHLLRSGQDITLAAVGAMVSFALDAAEILAQDGVSARVIDVHTVKPLDGETLGDAAYQTGAMVTVEDHNVIGGLGGAVAEFLGENCPVPMTRVGVPDVYCESGAPAELFERYKMSVSDILDAARKTLARKEESKER